MKKELRKKYIEKRENLSIVEVKSNSRLIFDGLRNTSIYKQANHIMLYLSFRNEVDTIPILQELLQQNKHAYIPLTHPKTKTLSVCEVKDLDKDLEIGNFGVLEPKKEALKIVKPEILDLIIVPGVAFDLNGYRIGFGAGYYDRFLSTIPSSVPTISLAYEIQLVDEAPHDSYDIPVEYIITEKRIIHCKKGIVR